MPPPALHGRGKSWRKAVRFALTKNPVTGVAREPPSEFFRLVAAEGKAEDVTKVELPAVARAGRRDERAASSLYKDARIPRKDAEHGFPP